jgi:hypothetical protein
MRVHDEVDVVKRGKVWSDRYYRRDIIGWRSR